MAALHLRFLGTFAVARDDDPIVRFRSANVQGLLVYLVLERDRAIPRAELAALLWPDSPPSTANHNLRQSLYQLRRLLGDGYLVADRQTIRFTPTGDFELDVARFLDALERRDLDLAATYYAGDLLPGFPCDTLPFEEWLRRRRERLHRLALEALHELTTRRLARSELEAARETAWRQLELEPWRERAHRQLMEALARLGDRPGALAQYEQCARALDQELGVTPSPRTRALFEAIRAGTLHADGDGRGEPAHNLPHQTTPFVGRAVELDRLVGTLTDAATPLVTLVGPGGMGKTRLALEAAGALLARPDMPFEDGIYLVRLAPIGEAALLSEAIARAVGFILRGMEDDLERLADYLATKSVLLILDNFEHLLPEGRAMVATLLDVASGLQMCVTSRERLALRGEVVLPIEGLAFDHPKDPLASDAARLFIQTAVRVNPGLNLGEDESEGVARIGALTEGMPLALVLAGSWADTLPPTKIADEISHDLDFLASEMGDLPPRQRSMRAAYAYTWTQLGDDERIAFARLSVFHGGFTRRAARQVAGTSTATLAKLVRKSLVVYETALDRYHIHELLRQFGSEYLATGWQTVATRPHLVRDAHADYYLTALADRISDLGGTDQRGALRDIAIDYANVRAAWRWATERGRLSLVGKALDGLFYYHYFSGREVEGAALFARTRDRLAALAVDGRSETIELLTARLRVREVEFTFLLNRGDATDIEALVLHFRDTGNVPEQALAMHRLAMNAIARRDVAGAMRIYHEQLALWEQCGDQLQRGFCLTNISQLALLSGQIELGLERAEQALALQLGRGDLLGATVVHLSLGIYHTFWNGDYAIAADHFGWARDVADDMRVAGHLSSGVVLSRAYLGVLALFDGDLERAAILVDETARLAERKNTSFALALAAGVEGLMAVSTGDYARAHERSTYSLETSTHPGSADIAQLALALAATGAGRHEIALNVARMQWMVSVAMQKLPERSFLLLLLPAVAGWCAHRGEGARAVELLAMARAQPSCPHAWWDTLPLLAILDAHLRDTLDPEPYAAAGQRGRSLSHAETVTSILDDLATPA